MWLNILDSNTITKILHLNLKVKYNFHKIKIIDSLRKHRLENEIQLLQLHLQNNSKARIRNRLFLCFGLSLSSGRFSFKQ